MISNESREKTHCRYAPCNNEEFILHYLDFIDENKKDEFVKVLEDEFDITDTLALINEGEQIRKKIEGTIVEIEKIHELELLQCVKSVENLGYSGAHIGYYWYEVALVNDDTFTIYCKED